MNKDNMFYSESVKMTLDKYCDWYYHRSWGKLLHFFISILSPLLIPLLFFWYLQDVLGNIFNHACLFLLVKLPLKGMEST